MKFHLDELQNYLFSLPDQPTAIPYVTSYYERKWGFCISHEDRINLEEGEYEVLIDSELFQGVLNYGELKIKGESKKEVFLSTYICHPSMANNELSGPIVSMSLINYFKKFKSLEKTLRFVFLPETIGSIVYLNKNLDILKNTEPSSVL